MKQTSISDFKKEKVIGKGSFGSVYLVRRIIYNQIYAFDSFKTELKYGCVSMFIPRQGQYYSYGNMAYNKTSINFGWNQVMDWKRFGWE